MVVQQGQARRKMPLSRAGDQLIVGSRAQYRFPKPTDIDHISAHGFLYFTRLYDELSAYIGGHGD
ncbi:hypothetical protein AAF712_008740 [Marasmius tenuissimus]|uniref:Uncharacterized protein n=1 Tax=Marasmius tenuissimus TaxID=585030 RepID=A0ABR2ZRJ0_9AGAR